MYRNTDIGTDTHAYIPPPYMYIYIYIYMEKNLKSKVIKGIEYIVKKVDAITF